MSNVALYDRLMAADPFRAIELLAQKCAESKMLGVKNEAQAALMAVTCLAQNITPFDFNATYHVIDFKGTQQLTVKSEVLQARFQKSGGSIEWKKYGDDECEAVFSHSQYCPNGITLSVSMKQMKERGIATFMYDKYPRQMLKARLIAEGVRLINPDITGGYDAREELEPDNSGPTKKPLLSPKKKAEPEPKEADVTVLDEESTDAFLLANEDAVNAYLTHLKWIPENQTWRELGVKHRATIDGKLSNFLKTAKKFAEEKLDKEEKLETANA